jgi:hypothetical protein
MGLWVGQNTELPYLVGGGADLPEQKQVLRGENRNISDHLENLVVSDYRAHLQLALWAEGTRDRS